MVEANTPGVKAARISEGLRVRPSQCSRHRPDIDRTSTGPEARPLVQVGQTFGRLRVIVADRRLHGKRAADVLCACGSGKRIRHEHLLSGDIKSCGCLRAEQMDTWRYLREDDEAAAAAAQSRTDERGLESELLRVTLGRLNLRPPV